MMIIKEILIRHQVKDKISYELLNGYKFDSKTIFSIDEINATELNDPKIITYKANSLKRKAINEYYKFDNKNDVDIGVTLITNTPTKIMILDENMNVQFISLIPYNTKFYLRNIAPKKIIAIIGDGEVALSFDKI